jgi:hypothetical protein
MVRGRDLLTGIRLNLFGENGRAASGTDLEGFVVSLELLGRWETWGSSWGSLERWARGREWKELLLLEREMNA